MIYKYSYQLMMTAIIYLKYSLLNFRPYKLVIATTLHLYDSFSIVTEQDVTVL